MARARRIQRELDALAADAASMGEEVAGEARLGVIGTTARWLVPQLLRRARRPSEGAGRHPRSQHHVADPLVVAGGLDLAVVNLPVEDPEIDTSVLFTEELVLLATASPLYGRTEVSFSELSGHPLVLPPPGTRCGESWTPRPGGRG